MAKVALLANGPVGLRVAEELIRCGDTVTQLYIHNEDKRQLAEDIALAAQFPFEEAISAADCSTPENLDKLRAKAPDYLITVYWAHLLKPELFQIASSGTVNFHPAPLPINRGWYPHVHSLIDGSPFGVTLHAIDADADTGPIWAQKIVKAEATDTAGDIYARLQDEIFKLFCETWPKIKAGEIEATGQTSGAGNYHKKKEIDELDQCKLNMLSAQQLLNRLRARTFGKRGFAYFEDENGERVYMHLRLSRNNLFD